MFFNSRMRTIAALACLALAGAPAVSLFSAEKLLRHAASCRQQGRTLEALSFYRDISLNAWSEQVAFALYQGLADIYYEYLDDTASALKFYQEMLGRFPDQARSAPLYHRLARLCYRSGDRRRAVQWYQDLLAGFPDYYRRNKIDGELKSIEQGGALLEDVILSVERAHPGRIRVLVAESSEPVALASDGAIEVSGPAAADVRAVLPRRPLACAAAGGRVLIEGQAARPGPLKLSPAAGTDIRVNGTAYRGSIVICALENRLLVINDVGLEEYLYGVLPREISPGWPEAVLKAQAVAARTYALYNMVKRSQETYDVFATTASQVYGGRNAECEAATRAVDMTRGLVLAYGGRLALTLFHANSGGRTEQIEDVWGSRLPYLQSVDDGFSADQPGSSWRQAVPAEELQQRLAGFGLPSGNLQDIIPRERAASGRIKKLEIAQPGASFYLTGNSFRLIVGAARIKSSNFSVSRSKDQFLFEGRGYGHGVGMSQWGARSMARQGYGFQDILAFYYPGTELRSVKGEG